MVLTRRDLMGLTPDNLLHRLWTKAVGTPEYDKAEWMELERRLALAFFRAPGQASGSDGKQELRLSPAAVERWQAGRTDVQMAQAAEMTAKNWSVLRRGAAKDPPLSTYITMCQVLGCGFSDLLESVAGVRVTQGAHGEAQDLGEALSTLEPGPADLVVDDLGEVVGVERGGASERGNTAPGDAALGVGDALTNGGARRQGGLTVGGTERAHGGQVTMGREGGVKQG